MRVLLILLQSLGTQRVLLLVGRLLGQLLGKILEELIDAHVLLRRDLMIHQALATCVILRLFGCDLAIFQIDLVADDDDEDVSASFLIELLDPLLALLKAVPTGDIINDACSDGVFVVHLGKGPIALLTRRVPHLVFDNVVAEVLVLREEAATDGRLVSVGELAVSISVKVRVSRFDHHEKKFDHLPDGNARLADTHVSEQDNFVMIGLLSAVVVHGGARWAAPIFC